MIDGYKNFLSGKQNEQIKLGVGGEADPGIESCLILSFVHSDAVDDAAVTLENSFFFLLEFYWDFYRSPSLP